MSPMSLQFHLPPKGRLKPNNERDPLPYYYRPGVGWLYRHRLQMGLDLLPSGGRRVLEVGVGSGILVPTLTAHYPEYLGTDLVLAPGLESLVASGCQGRFQTADLLAPDALPEAAFDAVVCFSVLEHIADADGAARALARTLAPGGTLVTGYPMVNPLMTQAFKAIGYSSIDDDHVSQPARIGAALARVLRPVKRAAFPPAAPVRLALYQCTSWTRD
jgi:2-polyprenyl-3-methyl-5-hydroxy-6-metoxy-1,4-benzoquinol methylase